LQIPTGTGTGNHFHSYLKGSGVSGIRRNGNAAFEDVELTFENVLPSTGSWRVAIAKNEVFMIFSSILT
jgi:hypothetical protein